MLLLHTIDLESDIEAEPPIEISDHAVEETTVVIHVVNIDEVEGLTEEQAKPQIKTATTKLILMLLFSITLHILAFYLVSLRVQLPTFSEDGNPLPIVQARLYTPPQIKPATQPEIAEPEIIPPVELPETEPLSTPEETAPAQTTEETTSIEETVSSTPEPIEEATAEPIADTSEQPEPKVEANIVPEPTSPPTTSTSLYGNRAIRDLSVLEQQKRNNMMNQAFQEFQYNEKHPEIKTSPQTALDLTAAESRQLADEKLLSSRPTIKANCKNAAGKALNIIGLLVGGAVECVKNPEISSFIQKRLNKSDTEKQK